MKITFENKSILFVCQDKDMATSAFYQTLLSLKDSVYNSSLITLTIWQKDKSVLKFCSQEEYKKIYSKYSKRFDYIFIAIETGSDPTITINCTMELKTQLPNTILC